jgi:hypothetical protein
MAIVTWPLSSGEARGRIDDLVYNTWRGRSYVKQHVHKQSGLSDLQKIIQDYARNATAAWHTIDQAKRDAWNHFATSHFRPSWTGAPKRLTGYNWFLISSVGAQMLGLSGPDIPPPDLPSYIWSNLAADVNDPLQINLTWTPQDPSDPPLLYAQAWIQGPHNVGITPSIKRAHHFSSTPEQDGTIPIYTADPGWHTAFLRIVRSDGFPGIFQHITVLVWEP